MRGRKPKPTARQIFEGDPRKLGIRKLAEKLANEPNVTHGLPECPEHLAERARKAWDFWVEELVDMNLDCRPDAMMLEGACVNYARAVDADVIVSRDGIIVQESTVDEESGEVIVLKMKSHPAIAISNAAWRQVRAFCGEFGLSPVSRTRLSIEKRDTSETDLMAALSMPRTPLVAPVQ